MFTDSHSNFVIAIDGPAGAGKSSIARAVAHNLDFQYIDTGAFYRALGFEIHKLGISPDDTASIIEQGNIAHFALSNEGIIFNGQLLTQELRSSAISTYASQIARIPEIRAVILQRLRGIAEQGNLVMEGRDIGTCVLPNANLKFFITASAEIRAYRRWLEFIKEGSDIELEVLSQEIRARDKADTTRADSPLRQAEDALLIDTTNIQLEQIIEQITEICRNYLVK